AGRIRRVDLCPTRRSSDLYGGLLTAVFLVWGGIFLHYFQKKLTLFTDSLCRTLDDMMDSAARPEMDYEAETLLARISHRLERLRSEEHTSELQSRFDLVCR